MLTPGASDPARVGLATPADAGSLIDLILAFRDHLGDSRPSRDAVGRSLGELLRDPRTDFLLARATGGEAVGYAQLRHRISLWTSGLESEIEDLFVVASARRRGTGAALLACAIARARERDSRAVGLATNERNAAALRLYRAAELSAERGRWKGGRQLWLRRLLDDGAGEG